MDNRPSHKNVTAGSETKSTTTGFTIAETKMKLERVSIRHYLNNSVEKPIKLPTKTEGVPSFNINHRNNYITLSFDNENKLNEFKNLAPVNSEIKLIKIAYTNKKLQ
ncbi:hypothetical protein BB559_000158 [Furculomyces boomerangus]|uniref:Uncharacterized protein n=1 Tax=Furculomyces boomerangus TaxID=61424 RepID=A0A2T9Z631_9FUNG|nr:hypothetical protein BB559_000158 [Furculomyces boomerangus]